MFHVFKDNGTAKKAGFLFEYIFVLHHGGGASNQNKCIN